jgi:Protein of unknown function DUF262
MGLQKEIDAGRSDIRSDDYGMSIGEWISLYESKEIELHPAFRRFYQWDIWQKSRFIESILLGIPIPPILVWQREDGIWDVIDGLQRLATIFQFVGILKDEKGDVAEPLALEATDYLPSLKGAIWNVDTLPEQPSTVLSQGSPKENKYFRANGLTMAQRLLIRRAKLPVNIILKESEEKSTYDLFLRLKSVGTSMPKQKMRNCILVSINDNMYDWLKELSHEDTFIECVNLMDQALSEQYDLELVLKFIVFRDLEASVIKNIGDADAFLTTRMRDIAFSKTFDREKAGKYFKKTFELLAGTTRENSFRRYDTKKNKFVGGFLVSAFEAVTSGIGYNLDLMEGMQINIEENLQKLWQTQEFIDGMTEASVSRRLPMVISSGREVFKP